MAATPVSPDLKSIRLIHLSLVAGVLLFLVVALFARPDRPVPADPRLDLFLLVAGAGALIVSQVLKARLPARSPAEPIDAWWRAHHTEAVIVWSLIEGASIMGLVGFWLTGSSRPLAATAAGLVLFVLTAPGRLASE